jgi:hypothetical protein
VLVEGGLLRLIDYLSQSGEDAVVRNGADHLLLCITTLCPQHHGKVATALCGGGQGDKPRGGGGGGGGGGGKDKEGTAATTAATAATAVNGKGGGGGGGRRGGGGGLVGKYLNSVLDRSFSNLGNAAGGSRLALPPGSHTLLCTSVLALLGTQQGQTALESGGHLPDILQVLGFSSSSSLFAL